MSLKYFVQYLIAIALGSGIGALLAHRLNPSWMMESNLIGGIIAITIVTLRILHTWRACKGDGSCGACPRRIVIAQKFEHFCGDHPRIAMSIRICHVLLIICFTGVLFIFGHAFGALAGLIYEEAREHGTLLVGKLRSLFR